MTTVYTSAGAALVVDIIGETTSVQTYYVAWGSGAGSFTRASTALFAEASEARVAASASQPTDNTNRWTGRLTANAAKTITEAGVFSVSGTAAGTMVVAGDFSGLVLASGDSIEFSIDLRHT